MHGYEEALDRILAIPFAPTTERMPLLEAGGRVLAEAPHAPFPMPRFSQSAMDGVALRARDTLSTRMDSGVKFRLVGESAAGHPFRAELAEGQAVRISTGAALPSGADAVIPLERLVFGQDEVTIRESTSPGRFVRAEGEDVAGNDELLPAGTRLDPAPIALLAAFNLKHVEVFTRPRVAIFSSGDEVRPHGATLGPNEIIGSSLYYLERELSACGCEARIIGIAPDHPVKFRAMLSEAQQWGDIIVTTAGVSVGEHDIVGRVIGEAGAKVLFWRVAVRPGRPMLVATLGGKPFFGLPGNAVSTICNTEIFLKPFLRRAFGIEPARSRPMAVRLGADCQRDAERLFFVYARIEERGGDLVAVPLPKQSSANIMNPARAQGLLIVGPGPTSMHAGEIAHWLPVTLGL